MFGVTRDVLRVVLNCLEGYATFDECQMAKEFVRDMLRRAEQSDDYIAYMTDVVGEVDVEEILRHEEAIEKLSEIYQIPEETLEAIIGDYFELMEGGDLT